MKMIIAVSSLFISTLPAFGEQWEMRMGSAVLGKETVTRAAGSLSAEGGFNYMGVEVKEKYSISFDASGAVKGYTGNVVGGGRNVTAVLTIEGNTARMKLDIDGKPAGEKAVTLTATALLMDNNIMSQFTAYSAILDPESGAKRPVVLLVPQVLSALNAEAELKKGTYAWKAEGRSGTAVMWEITSPAPLLLRVYQDVLSRSILKAEIPQGQIAYSIVGLAMEAQTAAVTKPAYVDQSKINEKSLTITTGGLSMGATLTYPKTGKGPFPGVLLVAGSGPNDRDETVGSNKPFRDIAWGLAREGFAVLRFDKRTYAYRTDPQKLSVETMTVEEEFIRDSVQAFRVLAADPTVDAAQLSIIGHSLGAWGLPFIVEGLGADAAKVRHLVYLAPAGSDFSALLLRQFREKAAAVPDSPEMKAALAELEKTIAEYKKTGNVPGPILGASGFYWKSVFDRNPVALAKKIPVPMFFVRGGKDIQVAESDVSDWLKALAGRRDVTSLILPDANHLLMDIEGPSTGAEYFLEGYVSEKLIRAISAEVGSK